MWELVPTMPHGIGVRDLGVVSHHTQTWKKLTGTLAGSSHYSSKKEARELGCSRRRLRPPGSLCAVRCMLPGHARARAALCCQEDHISLGELPQHYLLSSLECFSR